MHTLVIHCPSFQPEFPVDQSPTPTNMTQVQVPDAPAQLVLVNPRHRNGLTLNVAVLTRQRQLGAEIPGIDPAEHRQLCDVAPSSEVSLG